MKKLYCYVIDIWYKYKNVLINKLIFIIHFIISNYTFLLEMISFSNKYLNVIMIEINQSRWKFVQSWITLRNCVCRGFRLSDDVTIARRPPWRRYTCINTHIHADTCIHTWVHIYTCTCVVCGANKTLQGKRADAINFSRAIEGVAAIPLLRPPSSYLFAPSLRLFPCIFAFPANKYLQASKTSRDKHARCIRAAPRLITT